MQETLPIHVAIANNDEVSVVQLLDEGANPNVEAFSGMYALEHAICERMSRTTIKKLLASGADIEGAEFYSPLIYAVQLNHNDAIELLLKAGADPNVVENEAEENTPLALAAYFGNIQAVKLLLEAGADPRRTTKPTYTNPEVKETPLQIAAKKGHTEIMAILEEAISRLS